MSRVMVLLYGVASYAIALAVFLRVRTQDCRRVKCRDNRWKTVYLLNLAH